ncbi:unnamed protein product [Leuciscus chuanchicus]
MTSFSGISPKQSLHTSVRLDSGAVPAVKHTFLLSPHKQTGLFRGLVSANGNVLRSEIVGSIKMRVFLSGMPELRLGLNDKVLFENTGQLDVVRRGELNRRKSCRKM